MMARRQDCIQDQCRFIAVSIKVRDWVWNVTVRSHERSRSHIFSVSNDALCLLTQNILHKQSGQPNSSESQKGWGH